MKDAKMQAASVTFHSSHVQRDFSNGLLAIDVARRFPHTSSVVRKQVTYSVPVGFHVHNDCVAAALLTLVGRTCPRVTFNFPISERCALILRETYDLLDVGPVDPHMEPRQPGRHLAINFSGGTDSTGLYLLLEAALGDDFKVITCDFGPTFRLERAGYQHVRRDVTCVTDLRAQALDRAGRFISSVAMLHADYLDLHSVASGHTLLHEISTLSSLMDGDPPDYRSRDAVYHGAGLEEAHIVRGLQTPGIFRIIIGRAPHWVEGAFAASARPVTEKYYSRAVWVRQVYRDLGLPLPDFLKNLPAPTIRWPHNPGQRFSMFTLWALKYEGVDAVRPLMPHINPSDFAFLNDMSLFYMEKYNTNVTPLIPSAIRPRVLSALQKHGICPYNERDWQELAITRREMFSSPTPWDS